MAAISLRDFVTRVWGTDDVWAAAFSRYQKDARSHGRIWFGEVTIPATKVGRGRAFEDSLVASAIEGRLRAEEAFECATARKRRATKDFEAGVLQGSNGSTIETDWGYYRRRDPFHFQWSAESGARRRSDVSWYCNTCMRSATEEHSNPESHRCSDWGSCGRDCTLSGIACTTCGTRLSI
jgi:hypothetical protein